MKKSKITAAFLSSIMALSVVSCGKTEESVSEESAKTSVSENSEPVQETEASSDETETSAEESKTEPASEENSDEPETVSASGYFSEEAPEPPLWKVTDPESGNTLYLMGTIHVLPDGAFDKMPDYVMDIYENSDGIAVEYDIVDLQADFSKLMEFSKALMLTDGTTIADHISEETYETAKEYLQSQGVYNAQLDNFKPGYWITLLTSNIVNHTEGISFDGIDANFINLANKDGKEIINIEDISAQIDVIIGYSDELADTLLIENVKEISDVAAQVETLGNLYNRWVVGDEDSLIEIDEDSSDELPDDLVDDYEEYNNIVLAKRNKQMAERASEFIKDGKNYFFMVGSMHYAGDEGVDDLLRDMGYTVEKITA